MNIRLQQYRFIDSKAGIITLATIHLMSGVILLAPAEDSILLFGRGQLCLSIAACYALLYWYYDWQNTGTNIFLTGFFLLGIIGEWSVFGLPVSSVTYHSLGPQYSKGFALPFFMKMLPWFYIGLRLSAVYFLLHTSHEAYKLRRLA